MNAAATDDQVEWGESRLSTVTTRTHGLLHAGDQIDDGEFEREVHIYVSSHALSDGQISWSFTCKIESYWTAEADSGMFKTDAAARKAAESVARRMMGAWDDLAGDWRT